jgi:light-regulated signal transduction histidine kinase (bacteriophytochrome)
MDEKNRHYMATISDAAKRMGTLIDDLISFSGLGFQTLSKSDVNLHVLVQEVVRELEPETTGRTIRWRIHALPVVQADRALIQAVLVNLLSNAIKFTRTRAVGEIEIGYRPGQAEVVIYVRDNGVGFDMKYADKLFGIFQRLHHANEFEGTGIGLANVRRILAHHDGRIWAQSKPDQGAAFFFALPHTIQRGKNGAS